jgi:hypothetical protein
MFEAYRFYPVLSPLWAIFKQGPFVPVLGPTLAEDRPKPDLNTNLDFSFLSI